MVNIQKPEPVMGLVATLYNDSSVLDKAVKMLERAVGPVHRFDQCFRFNWTDYYQKEMGSDLQRGFLKIDKLLQRDTLADLKLLTNRIEHKLSRSDGNRRINLDPGLLSSGNLILASTKNCAHRIYLKEGIFAEVTLWYVRGGFETLEWTYPDYRSVEILSLLEDLRKQYLALVRHKGKNAFSTIDSIKTDLL